MGWIKDPTLAGMNAKGQAGYYWSKTRRGAGGSDGMPVIPGMRLISDQGVFGKDYWTAPEEAMARYYAGWPGGAFDAKGEPSGAGSAGGHGRGEGLGGLNIPDDAYPWSRSGLPQWGMDLVKGLTTSRLPGLMDSYQASLNQLAAAPGLIDQWVDHSGDTFLQGLGKFQDFIRKPLAGLAGRGVLDSTITRDALTDIGSSLGKTFQDFMNKTTGQGLALKAANLMDQAQARGRAVALGGDLLGLAHESRSEDKLARWATLLQAVLG